MAGMSFDETVQALLNGRRTGQAIFGTESSYGKNTATSPDGARGPMQIIPATFQRYAVPGEDINNPQHNRNVGQRIIDTYALRWRGDPSRIATAYISGEGNVNPQGPVPFKRNPSDSLGTSVTEYISSVLRKMSPIGAVQAAGPMMQAQQPQFGSFDEAVRSLSGGSGVTAGEPSVTAGEPMFGSFDEAVRFLGQSTPPPTMQAASAPPVATADVQVVPDQQPIPIDPNAVNAPESPNQGSNALWRDLLGMAQMIPGMGMRVPIGGLARLAPFGFSSSQPAEPPAAAPRQHWSQTQARDSMGRFTRSGK